MKTLNSIIIAAVCALSIDAAAQSFTIHTKSGEEITYTNADVDSIVFHDEAEMPPMQAPRIGDFYYSDGTWSTALKEDATPIGVVFCVGEATAFNDHANYYRTKSGAKFEEFHGYVVALRDATYVDGEHQSVWWSAFDSSFTGTGASTSTSDFLGYTNTKSIVATAIRDKGNLTAENNNYPAAYYATIAYEEACPAPESSSGWFLPSAYQFKYIYERVYFDEDNSGRSCIENSFNALGEDVAMPMYDRDSQYWTSTEQIDSYGTATWAYYFCFDSSMFTPGFIANYRKNAGMRVRSMLAF